MKLLKQLRTLNNETQADVAAFLKITRAAYTNIENGKREPDFDTLKKLASHYSVTTDYLLGRDEPSPEIPAPSVPGSKWIPVLGYVRAGIPTEAVEDILDYEEISPQMAQHGEYFALKIKGDSMEPRIKDGDVVIVRKQDDADSGDVAVVIVNGDDATVKRIKKRPEGLMLIPNNPAYEPMFYSNEEIHSFPVTIVGKVVELRAKL